MNNLENLSIYQAVRSVPENAKKVIQGGRLNGKTDINPMWRIKTLTEQFGPVGIGWYYKTIQQWTEQYGEQVAAFVNIELYVCYQGEWSKPIFGTGGSMFAEKERNGIHVSDECFKMATTDAISVACKQLGIGADVYWEKDKTKYSKEKAEEAAGKETGKEADERFSLRKELEQQCTRCGYGVMSLKKTYKVESIDEMSKQQLEDAIRRMKNLPNAT